MQAYLNAMRRYASFGGRTSRAEFCWAHAVLLPLTLIAFWVFGAPGTGRSIWPILLFVVIVVPHIVPWAALIVRRLHDSDRAGWWALASLIPLVAVPPLGFIALLAWGALRGTPGPNRFGPEPLDAAAGRAAAHEPRVAAASIADTADTPPDTPIAELERLALLRANGTLTAAEFEALKAKALGARGTA